MAHYEPNIENSINYIVSVLRIHTIRCEWGTLFENVCLTGTHIIRD